VFNKQRGKRKEKEKKEDSSAGECEVTTSQVGMEEKISQRKQTGKQCLWSKKTTKKQTHFDNNPKTDF